MSSTDYPVLRQPGELGDAFRRWERLLAADDIDGADQERELELTSRAIIQLMPEAARVPEAKVIGAEALMTGDLVWYGPSEGYAEVVSVLPFASEEALKADPQHEADYVKVRVRTGSGRLAGMTFMTGEGVVLNDERHRMDAWLRGEIPGSFAPATLAGELPSAYLSFPARELETGYQILVAHPGGLLMTGVVGEIAAARLDHVDLILPGHEVVLVLDDDREARVDGMQHVAVLGSSFEAVRAGKAAPGEALVPAKALRAGARFRVPGVAGGHWLTVTDAVPADGSRMRLAVAERSTPVWLAAEDEVAVMLFRVPEPSDSGRFELAAPGHGSSRSTLIIPAGELEAGHDALITTSAAGFCGAATIVRTDAAPDGRPSHVRLVIGDYRICEVPLDHPAVVTRRSHRYVKAARHAAAYGAEPAADRAQEGAAGQPGIPVPPAVPEDHARLLGELSAARAELNAEQERSRSLGAIVTDMLDGVRGGPSGLRVVGDPQIETWEAAWRNACLGDREDMAGYAVRDAGTASVTVSLPGAPFPSQVITPAFADMVNRWGTVPPEVTHRADADQALEAIRQAREQVQRTLRGDDAWMQPERSQQPEKDWPNGMHELHCRDDRCVFGCGCWCHGPDGGNIAVFAAATYASRNVLVGAAEWNALTEEQREHWRAAARSQVRKPAPAADPRVPGAVRKAAMDARYGQPIDTYTWDRVADAVLAAAYGVIRMDDGDTAWLPDPTSGSDYIPFRRLYLIETEVESGTWLVDCRVTEDGYGTPLTWLTEEGAEGVIRDHAHETGCWGDQRVLEFTMTRRFEPPEDKDADEE